LYKEDANQKNKLVQEANEFANTLDKNVTFSISMGGDLMSKDIEKVEIKLDNHDYGFS
jgi:hypothetical protein